MVITVIVLAVVAVVGVVLFLKHNPAKAAQVNAVEQKVATVVTDITKKL